MLSEMSPYPMIVSPTTGIDALRRVHLSRTDLILSVMERVLSVAPVATAVNVMWRKMTRALAFFYTPEKAVSSSAHQL